MKIRENFNAKEISWVKIGGPLKKYVETESEEEFIELTTRFIKEGEKFEILGWGANTLISDKGIDGILIRNKSNEIKIGDKIEVKEIDAEPREFSRLTIDKDKGTFRGITYEGIDYDEPDKENIIVTLSSGVGLPYAINYLIDKGITGLQMFSGIPGGIGGSVFNNIHGGPRLLSEYIHAVTVITSEGRVVELAGEELSLGYNQSVLQKIFFRWEYCS